MSVWYSISEVSNFYKSANFILKKVSYSLSGHVIVVAQLCSVHTHCEGMVQLAYTIIGLISLETYLNECAAVLLVVMQCCLATSCTPDGKCQVQNPLTITSAN